MKYWECNCLCHKAESTVSVFHVLPCCLICPNCEENIGIRFYNNELHQLDCKGNKC